MREVIFDIEEFKAKVDNAKPLHHAAWRKPLDREGIFYELTFRIYGISKNGSHILVYEAKNRISTLDIPSEFHKTNNAFDNLTLYVKAKYEEFEQIVAKPLGSTEGKWEE
jgi:hypothetical protein